MEFLMTKNPVSRVAAGFFGIVFSGGFKPRIF